MHTHRCPHLSTICRAPRDLCTAFALVAGLYAIAWHVQAEALCLYMQFMDGCELVSWTATFGSLTQGHAGTADCSPKVGHICRCGKCRQIAPFVEELQVLFSFHTFIYLITHSK